MEMGVFREIEVPRRIVATEKFDEAWYPGEAVGTTTFVQQGKITKITIRLRYESHEARDTVHRTNMERGMAASLNRLEGLVSAFRPGPDMSAIAATDEQKKINGAAFRTASTSLSSCSRFGYKKIVETSPGAREDFR